jgi:hypothetical protein
MMISKSRDCHGNLQCHRIQKFFKCESLCEFCQKIGHTLNFCPSLPTEPPTHKRIPFVESLLTSPKWKMKRYEGMRISDVLGTVVKEGIELNLGNPWESDQKPYSSLRKNLGFWKAIGADKSVLSWIAYGYQMRFVDTPHRAMFRNAPNTRDYEEFIESEIKTHLSDGSFVEVKKEDVWVVNPFLVSVNSNGKPRRCDDMRFVNAFMASPVFTMQTLDKDVPNIVLLDDMMITRDLEKAYYKIPIYDESTKFQCFFWKGKYYQSKVLLFGFVRPRFCLQSYVESL